MSRTPSAFLALSLVAGLACSVSLAQAPATPAQPATPTTPATPAPKAVPAAPLIAKPGEAQEAAKPDMNDPVVAAMEGFKAKRAELMKAAQETGGRPNREDLQKAAVEALSKVNIESLSYTQLKAVGDAGVLGLAPQTSRDAYAMRLNGLAKESTADGARAALLALAGARTAPKEKQTEIARTAVTHPKLSEVIGDKGSLAALAALDNIDDANLKPIVNDIVGLAKVLPDTVSPQDTFALRGIVMSLSDAATPAEREPLRLKALKITQNTLAKLSEGDKERDGVMRIEKMLDGAYIKNGLIGYPAPELNFAWSSTEKPFTKLSDLKGKVVVVDFWATWCGPCRASFPNVQKLQAYYKDSPVVILGVTSLQGSHSDPKAEKKEDQRIDCKGDANKEYGLMPSFIKNWGMTWPVVFSAENVFNPEYGVNGIPHVVIIDAKGVVRYRGLHPGSKLKEKTEHINDLLKEANLPVPAPFVEEEPAPKKAEPAKPADNTKN